MGWYRGEAGAAMVAAEQEGEAEAEAEKKELGLRPVRVTGTEGEKKAARATRATRETARRKGRRQVEGEWMRVLVREPTWLRSSSSRGMGERLLGERL